MYVMGVYAFVSCLTYPENDAIPTPPPPPGPGGLSEDILARS